MRSVLAIFAIALGGAAMAQTTLTDNECRNALTASFNGIPVLDPLNITARSYVVRTDTIEAIGGRMTSYISALKVYDDGDPTNELLKSELTVYRGTNLIQRTVADGRRVWSYDPAQNAYRVDAYNTEQGTNAPNYRTNYFNLLKQNTGGASLNMITLLDQASLKGTAWVKDWLAGLRFDGLNTVIPNDPLNANQAIPPHQFDTIWQKVPDGTRFVQFNLETFDAGTHWVLNSIQVHRQEKAGSSTKVSDSTITFPKDTNGLPLVETRNSAAFVFRPPAQSKVLASQRTLKF